MNYGSVCSGIEAATVAWHPLGWKPQFFSEIEPFPCSVLAHHYPDVPNYGDMTKFKEWPDATLDVLVGGTPCQSFSVAGLRKGLADPRGNLMLTYLAIADRYRPKWLVWENVPGVLSSNGGRDFGTFLGGLGQLGYGFAYRVLDAQYCGVPQRRRRVFVVGYFGDWRRAAAVLFERHSLQGHFPPCRKAGPSVAVGTITGASQGSGWRAGADEAAAGHLIPETAMVTCCDRGMSVDQAAGGMAIPVHTTGAGFWQEGLGTLRAREQDSHENLIVGTLLSNGKAAGSATKQDAENGLLIAFGGNNTAGPIDVAVALNANRGCHNPGDFEAGTLLVAHTLRGEGFDASEDGTGRRTPLVPVAFAENSRAELRLEGGDGFRCGALSTGGGKPGQGVSMVAGSAVRRLTPEECERLQGFPTKYTLIQVNKKGKIAADGPRYKALGNSMAVPCMEWIGRRIQMVEQIKYEGTV